MVESEANELSEDIMLGGVLFAHQEMQSVINVIEQLADEAGKPQWDWQVNRNTELKNALEDLVELTLMQLIRSLKNKIESLVLTIYVIERSMLSFQMTA